MVTAPLLAKLLLLMYHKKLLLLLLQLLQYVAITTTVRSYYLLILMHPLLLQATCITDALSAIVTVAYCGHLLSLCYILCYYCYPTISVPLAMSMTLFISTAYSLEHMFLLTAQT